MYEIWLVMNILWEIALTIWPLLLLGGVLWLLLMALALRRARPAWRGGFPLALLAFGGVALVAMLGVPTATQSSLAEMGYWVDWANLLAIAAGFGAVAAAFAWPLAALRRPHKP